MPQEFDDALYNSPIDISQTTTFPNEVYSDYVDLLIRHNVPNSLGDAIIQLFNKHSLRKDLPLPKSASQARKFIDNLHEPNSPYQRVKVGQNDDIDYYFEFRGIFYAIRELLANVDNVSSCVFKFNPEFITDEVSKNNSKCSKYNFLCNYDINKCLLIKINRMAKNIVYIQNIIIVIGGIM